MKNASAFAFILKAMGVGFIVAGAMHIVFGLGADQMIGASVSAQSMTDPGLDSQNRFYGAAFTLYGVLFFVTSTNIPRYVTILRCVLWVFLGAGLVRFISIALYGWPPPIISGLLVAELVIPPVLLLWLSQVRSTDSEVDW